MGLITQPKKFLYLSTGYFLLLSCLSTHPVLADTGAPSPHSVVELENAESTSCDSGYGYAYSHQEDNQLQFLVCKNFDRKNKKASDCDQIGSFDTNKVKEKLAPIAKSFFMGYASGLSCSLAGFALTKISAPLRGIFMAYNYGAQTLSVEEMHGQILRGERQLGEPPTRNHHYLSLGQKLCSLTHKKESLFSIGNEMAIHHVSSMAAKSEGMIADSKYIWASPPSEREKLFELYQKNVQKEQQKEIREMKLLSQLVFYLLNGAIKSNVADMIFATSEDMIFNMPRACISKKQIESARTKLNEMPILVDQFIQFLQE